MRAKYRELIEATVRETLDRGTQEAVYEELQHLVEALG